MPIYEYQCPTCGVFEVVQKITEPTLRRCPTCKSGVERLVSRTSFVLRGSGWYATDYARAANTESAGSDAANGKSPADSSTVASKPVKAPAGPAAKSQGGSSGPAGSAAD